MNDDLRIPKVIHGNAPPGTARRCFPIEAQSMPRAELIFDKAITRLPRQVKVDGIQTVLRACP